MNAVVESSRPDRVQIHTAVDVAIGRAVPASTVLLVLVAMPIAVVGLIRAGAALAIVLLPGVAFGFGLLAHFVARARPRVYASSAGLDLEWAGGKKRHIAWVDIQRVRKSSIGEAIGRCFHVELSNGSLDFFARSDFLELVGQFKRASGTELARTSELPRRLGRATRRLFQRS